VNVDLAVRFLLQFLGAVLFYYIGDACTRLAKEKVFHRLRQNTGIAIGRHFKDLDLDAVPSVLVAGQGPCCWGPTGGRSRTQRDCSGISRPDGL